MIVKGQNRDTAWFSMLDTEWPARRAAFERWLAPENFDRDGRQKTKLGGSCRRVIHRRHSGAPRSGEPEIQTCLGSGFRVRAFGAPRNDGGGSGRDRMHILITGAAGMIGRKLTERLVIGSRAGRPAGREADPDRHRRAAAAGGLFRPCQDPRRRSRRAGRRREGDLGAARGDLPSGRRGLGRGRARFRQGLPRQSRRHARAVGGDPQGGRRLQAAGGVHLVDGGAMARRSRTPLPTSFT